MSTDNATKTDLLSLQDRLNKLDAMADDPWKYKAVEWDEAYADAQYEARACKGMAMGAQAHDIAERFKRAGKRFHACAALDLVPAEKAVSFSMDVRVANADPISHDNTGAPPAKDFELWTGEDLYQHHAKNNGWAETWSQLGWADKAAWHRASAEMHNAAHGRSAGMAPKADPIGPGDPEPPPPPPTKALEPWTGEGLYVVAKERETGSKGVWSSQNEYQQSLWNMAARVANERMGIKPHDLA